MTNVDKLKGKIVEKRINPEALANRIGMDKSTWYRKLSGNGEEFTIKQADGIAKALELSPDEAMAIFFSQFVA